MQKTQQKKAQNIINANIAGVQTVPKKFKGNRRNNHPVVPHVYGHPVVPHVYAGQFVAPWDYAVCILGQRFLVCGNGRPDRILLFSADEGFGFLSNSRIGFCMGHLSRACSRAGRWAIILWGLDTFLIFPNFVGS